MYRTFTVSSSCVMAPPLCRRKSVERSAGGGHRHPGDGGAHEVYEVVAVEGLAHGIAGVSEAGLEALVGAPAALDVGVVGGEQRHLGAGLLHDPADVLCGVRREIGRA